MGTSWIEMLEPQKYSEIEQIVGSKEKVPKYIYFNKGL